jgi:hypothetical protein
LDFLRARVAAASTSWASAEARRFVFVRVRGGGVKIVSTAFLVRAEDVNKDCTPLPFGAAQQYLHHRRAHADPRPSPHSFPPYSNSHPSLTTSSYRPLSASEKPRPARERSYVTTNTTSTRSKLFRLPLCLLLLRLRHLKRIPRPSDCGLGCGCGSSIPSMKKTPACF